MFNTPLKVISFNCNSIASSLSRRLELANFLNEHRIDIALLCETFLKPKHAFDIMNYDVLRTDNIDGRGGGTAIAIRKGIRYQRVNVPHCISFMDVTGVRLYDHRTSYTFYSIYVSNNTSRIKRDCFNALFNSDQRVVVGGDFNSRNIRWGCSSTNSRGVSLLQYLNDHSNVRMNFPSSPTCFPSDILRRPSTIDGFLTKNVTTSSLARSLPKLFSDHNPVLISFNLDCARRDRHEFDYGRADWDLFRDLLDIELVNVSQECHSRQHIDAFIDNFESAIVRSLEGSCPRKRECHDEFPSYIREMITERKQT